MMRGIFITSAALTLATAISLVSCAEASQGLAGDHDTTPNSPTDTTSPDASVSDTRPDARPFPPPGTPVEPSPLTDQSAKLEDILEGGTLTKADCDSYFGGQTDRKTTLRCGKWMFFYSNLDVPGSPAKVWDLIRNHAPNTIGRSLEHIGLFPDPYSKDALPVGLVQGPDMTGGVATYTLTCGSCHFGKTPQGLYVVGSPNHQFSFGKYALAVATLPQLASQLNKQLAPEVEQALGPIRDEVFGNPLNRLQIIGDAIALLPSVIVTQASPPDDAAQLALANLATGVMDPYSPPGLDDGVPIPVRMSPLWGIDPDGMTAAGSTHGAMLGSNGGAPDLQHILRTFAFIAGAIRKLPLGQNYDATKVAPLIQYIMSLTPPPPQAPSDPSKVAAGKEIFHRTCFGCHNGPGFAGTTVFDPKEIGTDPNIVRLVDRDNTGKAMDDVLTPPELTKGLRARRLSAVWSLGRLFHNGSASSLADVFCLNGPRTPSTLPGHSTAGHTFTCDGLTNDEKLSLIAFLQTL